MKKSTISLLVLAILANHLVQAQNSLFATTYTNVCVSSSDDNQTEIHISLDKANPDNLVLCSNTVIDGGDSIEEGYYYSNDGGLTWSGADNFPNWTAKYVGGDPSTAFDADGNEYIASMYVTTPSLGGGPSYTSGYILNMSGNYGATWTTIGTPGNGDKFDKEMIAADDNPSSPYTNNVYCSWRDVGTNAIMFQNFTTSNTYTLFPASASPSICGEGSDIITGLNGEVFECFAQGEPTGVPYETGFYFCESANGGLDNFSAIPPYLATTYHGIDWYGPTGADYHFGYTRVNSFPSMAMDKSCGPYQGRIYVAYADLITANYYYEIQVSYSDPPYTTWTTATASINSGTSTSAGNSISWFPWIAVDDVTGVVCVAYYNLPNVGGEDDYSNVSTYMAYSSDGGNSFNNIQVSNATHSVFAIPSGAGTDVDQYYAGDYIGIVAHNGIAYPAWMDDRNGTWQAYVAPVTLGPYQINSNTRVSSNTTYQTSVEVTTGHTLTISSGVVVSMQQGTEIIVDQGAVLNVSGTITNYNACDNNFWDGIVVNGTTAAQTSSNQGTVILNSGSTIENALTGISTAGGIIVANGATFLNNRVDVLFSPYTNPANPLANGCTFTNCTFDVDVNYIGLATYQFPLERVKMTDVYGINFYEGNIFENLIPTSQVSSIYLRGSGIYSNDASYAVTNCDDHIICTSGCCGTPNSFTGFEFGIYASNANPSYNVEILGNTFTDNFSDIAIGDIDNMIVKNNTFTKQNYLGYEPLCFSNCAIPYNLYLDQSTGYNVSGNSYSIGNDYYTNGNGKGYGIVTNNSGVYNNLINNNSFTNIYIQTQAQGGNAGIAAVGPPPWRFYNTGLQYQCNQYTYTASVTGGGDIIVAGTSANPACIDPFQGSCTNTSTTANNTFDNGCSSNNRYNIYNYPSPMYDISYFSAGGGPSPNSGCISTGVVFLYTCGSVGSGVCGTGIYSLNVTGSSLFANKVDYHTSLRTQKQYFQHEKDSLMNLLNKGNAAELFEAISNSNPTIIQDSLLAAGPYLSDSVLIAAVNSTLPAQNLVNVLIPNATLDNRLVNVLDSIYLPDSIVTVLNEYQTQNNISPRDMLIAGINYFQAQMDLTDNALITALLTDTNMVSPYDSAQAVLGSDSLTTDRLAQIASLQWAAGENTNALNTLAALQSLDIDSTYYNYCQLLPVLISLKNDSTGYLSLIGNSTDSTLLEQIAMDTLTPGYANARAVLEAVYDQQFALPIIPINTDNSDRPVKKNDLLIHSKQEPGSTYISNKFSLFPNPASNSLTIQYSLDNNIQSADIEIFDEFGNKILTWQLPTSQTMLTENIANLTTGFYLYSIIAENKVLHRGKLIIAR
jgi:hypothetical protein